ncbi:hypothetical protein HMPREF9176_0953 [Streptococcus downei F0415]|nr:hypothetical protein HMPREF9176_0953 [Streptococcus downei F0415]
MICSMKPLKRLQKLFTDEFGIGYPLKMQNVNEQKLSLYNNWLI